VSSYDVLRQLLSDRPIAFPPALARVLGGVHEALLFQQLAYWSDKGDDPEWIYKTREELREETSLNRYQQEQARATLKRLGVIQEERRGLPARMYFKIEWNVVFRLLEESLPVGRPSTNKRADITHLEREPPAEQMAEGGPTSESTTKITSERTTESPFEFSKGTGPFEKYDETRLALLPYAEDLARELNDQAPLSSTVTRLVNLYTASGLDLDTFLDRVMQARAITQERTAAIRTPRPDGPGAKPKMSYMLAVLEDLIGQTQAATGTGSD
jgi:hypothetical protein